MSIPYSVHRPAKNMGDAVRLFCLECQGSNVEQDRNGNEVAHKREYQGVTDCPSEGSCSLWKYRFGKNPDRKPSNPRGNTAALLSNLPIDKRKDTARTARNVPDV